MAHKEIWLSIIIPTFQRPEELARCLAALSEQHFEHGWEVIVIDDGGGDLQDTLLPFQDHLSLRYIYQPNSGPARARNRGAEVAEGERLAFLDDDCSPDSSWAEKLTAATDRHPSAAVGGHTVNSLGDNKYAQASQDLIDFLYEYHESKENHPGTFFTTNNLSLRKDDFLAVGGFDEGFERAAGEDREFGYRWLQAGKEMVYCPEVLVHHFHNLTLGSFARQHFNYGSAAHRYWEKRCRNPISFADRSLFYLELLSYPLKRYGFSLRGIQTECLFLVAQFVNALGYFSKALSIKLSSLFGRTG